MKKLLLTIVALCGMALAQGVTVENYSGGTNGAIPTSTTLNNGWFGYKFGINDNSGCNLASSACIDIGSNTASNGAITYKSTWPCADGLPTGTDGGPSALTIDYDASIGGGVQNVYIGQEMPSNDNGGSTIQMGVAWTCIPTAITNSGTIDDATITGTGSSAFSNLVNTGGGTMRYGLEGTGGQNGWPSDDIGANAPIGVSFQLAWYLPLRGACDVIGTVNTAGTAVTKASGASFNTGWSSLHINGVDYAATINSSTSATLSSSAGTQTGVAYSGAASSIANAIVSNCMILATYTRAGALIGFGYKSTGGTPGVACSGASTACQPTFFEMGDLNGAATSAGHIAHRNVIMCGVGCTSDQFPILENPAPLWQGILTPGRAVNWTLAGIPPNDGTLPSAAWTQSGSTISPYTGTTGTINTALGTCGGTNKYVLLGAGAYTLSGQITLPTAGGCELRISDGTTITTSGTDPGGCGLLHAFLCIASSSPNTIPSPGTVFNWTAGYAQGTSAITLSAVTGIVAGTILYLDQCDTGYSGSPCTGTSTDNSNFYNCEDIYSLTGPSGCSTNGGGGGRTGRQMIELHTAVSVVGSVVTITPPLISPIWASGQNPQVWIAQPISNAGVECLGNCIIDATSITSGTGAVAEIVKGSNTWIQGITAKNPPFANIGCYLSTFSVIQSNYVVGNRASNPSGYGIRPYACGNIAVVNNIIHNLLNPIFNDGPQTGSVFFGNYAPNVLFPGQNFMNTAGTEHWTSVLDLWDHNCVSQIGSDDVHGTSFGITEYRNCQWGWQSVPATPQNSNTQASSDFVYARYANKIGNVLGTSLYHTVYATNASATSIYYQGGATTTNTSVAIPADTLVKTTSLRFGGYDTVTAATRFCGNARDTNFASAGNCNSVTESPNTASTFPGMVPAKGDTAAGQDVLPASLFITAKPAWWASSVPFPAIGPDVSSGNVGMYNCTINTAAHYCGVPGIAATSPAGDSKITAWGGHVNAIPAMNCFLTTMGGKPDGSDATGTLTFNWATCFGSQAPPTPSAPSRNMLLTSAPGEVPIQLSAETSTSLKMDGTRGTRK